MKKGITVQPFIFILALVVMAFVITFGTKSIFDLKKTAEFTELGLFIDKLNDEVEKFENYEVGSYSNVAFVTPLKIKNVCFTNIGEPITGAVPDSLIRSAIEGGSRSNVYILPIGVFPKTDFYIERLRVKESANPLCINTKGRLDAALETALHNGQVYVEIHRK